MHRQRAHARGPTGRSGSKNTGCISTRSAASRTGTRRPAYQLLARSRSIKLELAANTLHEMCLELVQRGDRRARCSACSSSRTEFEEFVIRSLGGGRAEHLRPVRPGLRRRRPAEAAGVQRRHADRPARGGGRPVVLAQGHRRARRPVQQHPRAADRGLAGACASATTGRSTSPPWRASSRTTSPSSTCATPAIQAGFETDYLDVEQIGWDRDRSGRSWTAPDRPIRRLFKLYPWEWMVREEFGQNVLQSPTTQWIEPAWKMILSLQVDPAAAVRAASRTSPYLLPASFEPLEGELRPQAGPRPRRGEHHGRRSTARRVIETDGPYTRRAVRVPGSWRR